MHVTGISMYKTELESNVIFQSESREGERNVVQGLMDTFSVASLMYQFSLVGLKEVMLLLLFGFNLM